MTQYFVYTIKVYGFFVIVSCCFLIWCFLYPIQRWCVFWCVSFEKNTQGKQYFFFKLCRNSWRRVCYLKQNVFILYRFLIPQEKMGLNRYHLSRSHIIIAIFNQFRTDMCDCVLYNDNKDTLHWIQWQNVRWNRKIMIHICQFRSIFQWECQRGGKIEPDLWEKTSKLKFYQVETGSELRNGTSTVNFYLSKVTWM